MLYYMYIHVCIYTIACVSDGKWVSANDVFNCKKINDLEYRNMENPATKKEEKKTQLQWIRTH